MLTPALLARMGELARACWRAFGLTGYARVDFRVDAAGEPHVLEINSNPFLSEGDSFCAAGERAGLSFHAVIQRIIAAARARDGIAA